MHPLIAAWLDLRGWEEIRPRSWGLYYPMWERDYEVKLAWFRELLERES